MQDNHYIGYEYRDIITDVSMEHLYVDSYPYFGWKYETSSVSTTNRHKIILKFKRDRKLCNKAELTRLQRQFEASVHEILRLEQSKTTNATIAAFTIGIVGCAFMAGATFSYLGGFIWLMVLLAIPGFLGWLLPYIVYRSLYEKRTAAVVALIEQKYDEIYELCEKGNVLSGNDRSYEAGA